MKRPIRRVAWGTFVLIFGVPSVLRVGLCQETGDPRVVGGAEKFDDYIYYGSMKHRPEQWK